MDGPVPALLVSETRLGVCRTCRAFFPLGEGEWDCNDGCSPRKVKAEDRPDEVVDAEGKTEMCTSPPNTKEVWMCEHYRTALFFLCTDFAYSPYAVFRLRGFEDDCLRCEGKGDDDD